MSVAKTVTDLDNVISTRFGIHRSISHDAGLQSDIMATPPPSVSANHSILTTFNEKFVCVKTLSPVIGIG